jgi:hypothetical protein
MSKKVKKTVVRRLKNNKKITYGKKCRNYSFGFLAGEYQ